MAKRDAEDETIDPEPIELEAKTVGQRLRAAREEKKLSLEDIAAQTRIPRRHLESIEESDWDKLPAPTYTVGFARSYATVVGLDRAEVADDLRSEMGGQRAAVVPTAEVFEPADPARTMPKWLVLGAVAAVIAIVLVMSWLNERSLEAGDEPVANAPAVAPAPQALTPAPAPPQAAQGPVVLTATAPAWIRVTDQGKSLYEGVLQPGQSFTVPPTATAPLLRAGAPEAIRINVGSAVAPAVGPAGKVTSNVSLKPADVMRGPAPAAPNTAG